MMRDGRRMHSRTRTHTAESRRRSNSYIYTGIFIFLILYNGQNVVFSFLYSATFLVKLLNSSGPSSFRSDHSQNPMRFRPPSPRLLAAAIRLRSDWTPTLAGSLSNFDRIAIRFRLNRDRILIKLRLKYSLH